MDRRSTTTGHLAGMRPGLQAVLFGLLVGILLLAADQTSIRLGLRESQRILDDILGAILAGLLVFWYAKVRTDYIAQRLHTIALMNHHVRNALQVITSANYIRPEAEQVTQIKDAVQRIDWALREVLPGRVVEFEEGWKEQHSEKKRPGGFSATA